MRSKLSIGARLFLAVLITQLVLVWPVQLGLTFRSLALAVAIAERGRFSIDPELPLGDRVLVGDRYYAATAPGQGLTLAPVVWLMRRCGLRDPYGAWVRLAAAAIIGALATAMAALALFHMLRSTGSPEAEAALTAGALCLASFALPLGTVAFDQPPAFASLALSLAQIWSPREDRRGAFIAGLCAGVAVLFNMLAAIPALVIAAYFLSSRNHRLYFIAGAGSMALILAFYNTSCFGAPWRSAYGFIGPEEQGGAYSEGIMGFTAPTWSRIATLSISSERGLFVHAPLMLLAPYGAYQLWRSEKAPLDRRLIAMLIACVLIFLTNACRGTDINGGASAGPRYLLVILAFAAPFIAIGLRQSPGWLTALMVASGLALNLTECFAPWYQLPYYSFAELWNFGPKYRLALSFGASETSATVLALGALVSLSIILNEFVGLPRWRLRIAALSLLPCLIWLPGLSRRSQSIPELRRRYRSEQAVHIGFRSPIAFDVLTNANALLELQHFEAARLIYQRAARLKPKLGAAWLGIMRSSRQQTELDDAAARALNCDSRLAASILQRWLELRRYRRAELLLQRLPEDQRSVAQMAINAARRKSP